MQEISPNVFIDHNALGLITGLVRTEEGTVLIDWLVRPDESKPWKGSVAKFGSGDARFLITLDTNYDRQLSAKGSNSVIIAQANALLPPKTRQNVTKVQEELTGINDAHEVMVTSSRCLPPEITFTNNLKISIGGMEIQLESHSGSNNAGIWAILPKEKVIFVGDTVLVDQPPFLAYSNLENWIADIDLLISRTFRAYQIVSSRSGIVNIDQVRAMGRMLRVIQRYLSPLAEKKAEFDEFLAVIPKIMKRFDVSPVAREQYYNRLRWGLATYYEINFR